MCWYMSCTLVILWARCVGALITVIVAAVCLSAPYGILTKDRKVVESSYWQNCYCGMLIDQSADH